MKLPVSWTNAPIGELCNLINGMAFKPSDWSVSGLPIIRIQNLNRPDAEFNYFDGQVAEKFVVEPGELLFAWSGTPGTSFGAHIWIGKRAVLNQHIFRVRFEERDIDKSFFKLAINAKLDELIGKAHGGVGLAHVTKGKFEQTEIVLPPLAEQRRIVAKLDRLFARLARARAELDRIPTLADNLRKQYVSDVFDGTLTEDWRALNEGISSATDDELSHAYAAETGFKRKKPVTEIDWRPAVDLPKSWRWVSIDQLVAEVQYGSSAKTSSDESGVPVLRMGNIQRGKIDWTDLKYLPKDHDEFPDLLLREGDVVFNRTNSFELVGKTAAIGKLDKAASFASYLIKLRPIGMPAELLAYYLNSSFARRWVDRVASQQVGQANVNGSKLKALGIPLPPAEEQVEMLARISNAIARAARLEAEAARARALLDRLEAAILTKAFKGELVPQDPNDEPASVLLERIRGQRAAAAPATRANRPERAKRS